MPSACLALSGGFGLCFAGIGRALNAHLGMSHRARVIAKRQQVLLASSKWPTWLVAVAGAVAGALLTMTGAIIAQSVPIVSCIPRLTQFHNIRGLADSAGTCRGLRGFCLRGYVRYRTILC